MDAAAEESEICRVMDEMTSSVKSAREVISGLLKSQAAGQFDTKDGISLLSMKYHLLLSYIHSLSLLGVHRVLGHSLTERKAPAKSFSNLDREARGTNAGDLVDALVEDRLVLEKVKMLESRMRYQIDKLVKLGKDESKPGAVVTDDPLAFRPHPENLMENLAPDAASDNSDGDEGESSNIYRPPKLAPVPYTDTRTKQSRKPRAPQTLSSLQYLDASAPHAEKSTGLGVSSSLAFASSRAKELQRMTEFEEENMMRLVMNKKESKRRRRDEEDIALGGAGATGRGRQKGGLEDEFRDVLNSVGKSKNARMGDGYDELRKRGSKKSMLERARVRETDLGNGGEDVRGPRKKARFETDVKRMKKRSRLAK